MCERTVLVTGATGFIGSHLVRRLLAEGWRVRVLARDPARTKGLGEITVVRGDILRIDSLLPAVDGVGTVYHCAALVGSQPLSLGEYEATNVGGTLNVLDACRQVRGVRRIVHLSALGVTGSFRKGVVLDEESPPIARTRYQVTKLAAEAAVLASGLPVVVARPAWVYGLGSQSTEKLFRMIAQRRMPLIGDGENDAQPIEISDLVDGLLRCARTEGVEGRIYHFAGPRSISTKQMLGEIAAALGVPPPRIRIPMGLALTAATLLDWVYPRRIGRPPFDRARLDFFRVCHAHSLARARQDLGWKPKTEFADGAQRIAAELRAREMLS